MHSALPRMLQTDQEQRLPDAAEGLDQTAARLDHVRRGNSV